MKNSRIGTSAAFTLLESLLGAAAAGIVGVGIFSILNTGAMLSARNVSLNLTSNSLRRALDHAENLIQQSASMPTLIDTAGNATTGFAAGIRFDRYVGAPYVIAIPATGLPSNTKTLTLQRSTNSLASPPIPAPGDLLCIDGEPATLRPRVVGVSPGTTDALLRQGIVVTLAAPLGSNVTSVSETLSVKLLHNVALVVVPTNGKRELRYYPDYDPASNLSSATNYSVLTDQIGMEKEDATPFSLVQAYTKSFVNVSFRVRANRFDQRLLGRQGDQFNTFARLDVQIRPKVNP